MHVHLLCRSRDREGEVGGAAAAFAQREEERARERKNHKTKRRKDSTFWDVAPRGFEHISPLQYKAMQGDCLLVGSTSRCHGGQRAMHVVS